ncbi:MAG: hypothetical protein NC102_10730 [Clostridium sp.]|nr:hypothetical protein [Clostridium sp.]
MKKISKIMALAAMGIAFFACDKVDESGIPPQAYPQEAIFNADNLTVTDASAVNVSETLGEVQVGTYEVKDFPAQSTPAFKMQISKTEDFAKAATVECSVDTATCAIMALGSDVNAAYKSAVTRNPATGTAYVRFIAMAVNGTESVLIGGPSRYYGVGAMQVTPVNEEVVIENTYSFVCGGEEMAFQHSELDAYDDPVFKVTFDAVDGNSWQIKSASGKLFGPAEGEAEELEGALVADAEGKLAVSGPYSIEINMRDLTYKFAIAIDQLYTPGNSNGWNQGASQTLTTTDYVNYTGYVHLNGEFKFTSQPNWDGVNYGSTGVEGELTNDGGAGNLTVAKDALYWVQVNLVEMTYSLTEITSIGCIGGFNGWGGQANLEPSADFLIWTGEVTFNAGDEWKFRANDNWDINLGGSLDDLVTGGDNLVQAQGGKKTVILNLSARPYTAIVE